MNSGYTCNGSHDCHMMSDLVSLVVLSSLKVQGVIEVEQVGE